MTGRLERVLGIDRPVLLAGMGGVAGPELAVAVAAAGGLGVVGGYKAGGPALAALLDPLVDRTDGPIGVNLIPEVVPDRLLDEQLDHILLRTPGRLLVTTFGPVPERMARRLTDAGRTLVAQVGTVADAVALRDTADVIVLQGTEAGGHLLGTARTRSLVRRTRTALPDAVLVAAGGVAGAADAAAMAAAGADGVCCGTAFVATAEANAHELFKERVLAASAGDTTVTRVFEIGWPGRRHRVLRGPVTENPAAFTRSFIGETTVGGVRHPVCRFSAAVPTRFTEGRVREMAMYAGTSCDRVTAIRPAAEVVAGLAGVLEEVR
ncbi:NAD(P)H-dependent flavin oxidoreductase [Actinomadura rubrisoli]|uniref:Nitronate monooxygenase n=1 Tax=Actinomadura rubrisoli TaxID=2530368 RepID=A0A4R5B4H5_9ACTN|nr:nitronate monooxygenase [Actinomadura rubrisoli]TDD79196.1 nitronate monooxygenase [Actinomadura rubrisoli]